MKSVKASLTSASYACAEPAVETSRDSSLDFLDIVRFSEHAPSTILAARRYVVIGGGPAGLVFARAAAHHGARVTLLERAGDPRGEHPGYSNRSFNLTLDNVGRRVLGDPRSWEGGIWLEGRAIHDHASGAVSYARYSQTAATDAHYVSITRDRLRQNLATLAEEAGAMLIYEAHVTSADAASGRVTLAHADGRKQTLEADLIVFCDGLHSLAHTSAVKPTVPVTMRPEPRNYVTSTLDGLSRNLSMRHIHFWHESSGAYTVGIPNRDGSISLLLTSLFEDLSSDAHPFATPAEAAARLEAQFPHLLSVAPELPHHLPSRSRGLFHYKAASRFRVANRGLIMGDAGCAVPPWSGYGANTGMYGASMLVSLLLQYQDDPDLAYDAYETHFLTLTRMLMNFVEDLGQFFEDDLASNPGGRADDYLARLITRVQAVTPTRVLLPQGAVQPQLA